jgi:type IV pilus assembly protein PilO
MASLKLPSFDLRAVAAQFRGLQGRHPGLWPVAPRIALLLMLVVGVLGLGWAVYWRGQIEELEAGQLAEEKLRAQYVDKLKQAVNLDALRKQKEQVMVYVNQLEKQLPSKAEMDALLTDITRAGIGRGLQFELFKPGQVVAREFYAELPIGIRLVGNYNDLGAFTSEVSNLARIVTLNDIQLNFHEKTSLITMESIAKTFRYLDSEEIAQARREAAKLKQAARPGAPAAGGAKQ